MMTVYEIINPSDRCSMVAPDLKTASLACLLIGEGHYSARATPDGESVPLFVFGGSLEWYRGRFGSDVEADLTNPEIAALVADCLESVMVGDPRDREHFDAAPDKAAYNEKRRTSSNNIAGYARQLAGLIRSKVVEK